MLGVGTVDDTALDFWRALRWYTTATATASPSTLTGTSTATTTVCGPVNVIADAVRVSASAAGDAVGVTEDDRVADGDVDTVGVDEQLLSGHVAGPPVSHVVFSCAVDPAGQQQPVGHAACAALSSTK